MKVKVLSVAPQLRNGAQRTFEVQDKQTGENITLYSWDVELELVRNAGTKKQSLIAECSTRENAMPYSLVIGDGKEYEANLSFTVNQNKDGGKFNNIRLYGLQSNIE